MIIFNTLWTYSYAINKNIKDKEKSDYLLTFSIKKLGAHSLNDLRFHGNDKFWDVCQNFPSCHLALRPEITIFQRPLLWHSAGTASRVNEISCCTSLTFFICLFICLFIFFTLTWCKAQCLWTTLGKICNILTKKTALWILIRDPVSPKQNFLCKSIVLNEYKKMVVFSPFRSYTIRECIDILWV